MTCPNCDMLVKYGTICTHCGTDSVLLQKTVKISENLYNKGLAEAKSGNLTFAMESLQKSVTYNSNNTAARNLLGLIYFEVGRVADACRQWVISCTHIKSDNPAQKYLSVIEENANVFDQYAEAIRNYNEALTYINQRNEDMALIRLKRAVELNPSFLEALNLSCLCYIIQNDKEEAKRAVNAVLSIDVSNPTALNYYRILNPGRTRYSPVRRRKRDKQPTNYLYTKPKKLINVFHIASALLFVAGIALTSIFFMFAVIPQIYDDKLADVESLELMLEEYNVTVDKLIEEKDNEIARLLELNEQLSDERDSYSAVYMRQERINRVHTAQQLYEDGRLEEAAEYLYQLDASDLPRDVKDLYDDMASFSVLPPVTESLFAEGRAAYNASDYPEARRLLEKADRYAQDGSSAKAEIIYYRGLTAQAEDDTDAAVAFYSDFLENYPGANPDSITNADARLSALLGN